MIPRLAASLCFLESLTLASPVPKPQAISESTLREKLGQLLLVGFRGTEATDESHVVRDVLSQGVGGVLLYEYDQPSRSRPRNVVSPSQVQRLIAGLQARSKVPLLIAIDQEGGLVRRFKENAGFPALLSPKKLAQIPIDSARSQLRLSAKALAAAGVNLNLAPVVDLDIDSLSLAIGSLERSFGRDTGNVLRLARLNCDLQREAGVLSTLKHFPGQGSGRGDTHAGFVDVTRSWNDSELVPFQRLLSEGRADAVMTTHVFNARLDSTYPATLSPATVQGILRQKLSWKGIVVTDDLQMEAIRSRYNLKESFRLALNAGADILLLGNSTSAPYDSGLTRRALTALEELVHEGQLSTARIDSSWKRVMKLKTRLPRTGAPEPPTLLWADSVTRLSGLRSALEQSGCKIHSIAASTPPQRIDSLLTALRPDAVVLPFASEPTIPAAWRHWRVAVAQRPASSRPICFGAVLEPNDPPARDSLRKCLSTRDSSDLLLQNLPGLLASLTEAKDSTTRKVLLRIQDRIEPMCRPADPQLWARGGIVMDSTRYSRTAHPNLQRLVPLNGQNLGRMVDIASQLRERMPLPPRVDTRKPLKIVLDIGHFPLQDSSVYEKGAGGWSPRGVSEFQFNLPMARAIAKALHDSTDAEVVLFNEDGHERGLRTRSAFAKAQGADLLLSIHHDGTQDFLKKSWIHNGVTRLYNDDQKGFGLFVHDSGSNFPQALSLARGIGNGLRAIGLIANTHHADSIQGEGRELLDTLNAVYRVDFGVLASARMAAVLVECGMMLNRDEELDLATDAYRQRFAASLASSVRRWIRMGAPDDERGWARPRP